ncbi:alpha/beta-hydrolase [Gloeopeniophorella convolvens]|nr:alpha/beta-hydrolase [Gloeopeniophorella convolvens]
MSLCDNCFEGIRHEGEAQGKHEVIGGYNTYVATPAGDYPKDKAILYLLDAFGLDLINNPLQIDSFALNGFKVYAPDIFEGDPAPADMLVARDPTKFDKEAWLARHPPSHALSLVRKVMEALKEQGVTRFAAVGFCFGGRLTFDLAFTNEIVVSAVAHPSLLQADDLEKYFAESRAPLLINSCEVDWQFPKEKQDKADEIFGDGKFAPGYQHAYWEGCTHGFAVRGDLSDPKVKAGKEGSFKNTVEWFRKYL